MKKTIKKILVPFYKWYYEDRNKAILKEMKFWDTWIRTKGGVETKELFTKALNPNSEVDQIHKKYITKKNCKILEVGSGPLTLFGFKCDGVEIDLTPTDYLAENYNKLLLKYGVKPIIETRSADACDLKDFSDCTYDYIYAANCIDHTQDPISAIRSMLRVVKTGGTILMINREREADHEFWQGMHQWNFTNVDGDFIIEGKNAKYNISKLFSTEATITTDMNKDILSIEMKKTV